MKMMKMKMIKIINFVKEKIIQVCLKRKSLKYLDSKVIKKNCKKLSQIWAHEECLKRILFPVWKQKELSLLLQHDKIAQQ
jgi:hypothetical protein